LLTLLANSTAACSDQAQPPSFLPGYTHTFERSRFDLGDFVSEMDRFGNHMVVGSRGTFSTELASGAAVALPNIPFPDPATGVYPGDSNAQNTAVLSYFTTAGVPANQVASVSANGTGLVHGQYVLSGWYSILHREYDGVPIDDSMAFAAFNAIGKSASEQVYWPEIPGDVLEQVRKFREMLADPSQRAAYVQKLPASSRDAILVIHHTSFSWQGPFQAQACCRGAERTDICLDVSGHIVDLPDASGVSQ
jgi:hypothetical protein